VSAPPPDPFPAWYEALEARHLAALTFQEVRRGVTAISSLYVERRGRVAPSDAFEGAGKRAAFALYYGAMHFLTVREVVRSLGAAAPAPGRIVDLGCGTGAAGAAWALEAGRAPRVIGVDRSGWAVEEARWTLASLGLRGRVERGDLGEARMPAAGDAALAAWTANELDEEGREALRRRLLAAARRRARVLVVEPIARRPVPWWDAWAAAFAEAGGCADEWRFPAELPERLRLLDRAAGLDHRELTARSLYHAGG